MKYYLKIAFIHFCVLFSLSLPAASAAVTSAALEAQLCNYQTLPDITEEETSVRRFVSKLNVGMPQNPIILLCSLERSLDTVSVSRRYTQVGRPDVVVIWIRASLINTGSDDVLRFLLLRENHRSSIYLCAVATLPEYIPCEHAIDREFAERVKTDIPLSALRAIGATLEHEGVSRILTQLVDDRIAALLEYRASQEQKTSASKLAQ
jgi:hypothetical protein